MMVVDSSALLCLLLGEPESERVVDALENSPRTLISAPTFLEASIVAEARLGPRGVLNLQAAMRAAEIDVVAFTAEQAHVAAEAWRRLRARATPREPQLRRLHVLRRGHHPSGTTAVRRG